MQIKKEQLTPTDIKLTITASESEIQAAKEAVLASLSQTAKIPGFRPGKAPASVVEKNVDQAALQSQVLDELIGRLYFEAVKQEELRPAAQPNIALSKFVPFNTLEFTAEVSVVGEIKLADYKKIKVEKKTATVTTEELNKVIDDIRKRAATKEEVKRAAKMGDETLIDFKGVDATTKEAIAGADGKEYPLTLGSGSFIPGFEEEVVGLKAGEEKSFDIVFPADYGAKALQSKKVNFTIKVHSVSELKLAKLDDEFAKSVGPFKTVAELKADIKKQLQAEKQREFDNQYVNELIEKIVAKSEIAVPEALVNEEIDRLEDEEKRNLTYRGQTWEEHLKEEGVTAEEHREQKRDTAVLRIKSGLAMAEIASKENLDVSLEELELRLQLLKGQYQDPTMQAELDKPENRRDIHSRMMTEKTLDYMLTLAA